MTIYINCGIEEEKPMSKHFLEECHSLKEVMQSLKERLIEIDENNHKNREWYKEHLPERVKESMEEENWNDSLYLAYPKDDEEFYIFEDNYDIEQWLDEKWSEWGLWEYDDPNDYLEEELVIWKFHRNICKEKWEILYKNSKPFIDGWSRKREYAGFEAVPSFSVG
jgi:hypothetical protein